MPLLVFLRWFLISFTFTGEGDVKCKMAFDLVSNTVSSGAGRNLGSASHRVRDMDCSGWQGGRGSWLTGVLCFRGSQGGGASLGVKGLPLWSFPPFWRELGQSQRLAAILTHRWGGGGSQATSDNRTAAVTLGAVFLLFLGVENGEDRFIKNRFETFLSQGRAFQVALCSNRFSELHTVLVGERFLFHVQQTGQGFGVIAEINLGPYEDVRHVRHAVLQLRNPLLLDVVVRGRIYDREADQKHVGVGVGERS